MPDLLGKRFGNYRLRKLIGRGGFAEVYLGEHVKLQTLAAVKILHAHLSEDETQNFQREAQIIAQLDHPNIVRILDFDEKKGVPFLVMPFYEHGTLAEYYERGEQVALPEVISHVQQVAEALAYAHTRKLIHRDVKPGNMLIGSHGEILLGDFGIAAVAHSTSSMSSNQFAGGTISYMAPEQIEAKPRPASDQYALAVVAYEWLCGTKPFEGTITEVISKHLKATPPLLRLYRNDLPPEVEQVIMTALAKEPQQRFSSVLAFAHALGQAGQGQSAVTQARPRPDLDASKTPQLPPTVLPSLPPTIAAGSSDDYNEYNDYDDGEEYDNGDTYEDLFPKLPARDDASSHDRSNFSRRRLLFGLGVVGTIGALAGVGYAGKLAWDFVASKLPARPIYLYQGHNGKTVNAVAWSPNNKRIASGGADGDGTVQVWDAADGRHLYTFKGHQAHEKSFFDQIIETASVTAISWSPDGRQIASGSVSPQPNVQVWDAPDGGHARTLGTSDSMGHNAVYLAWSPNGMYLATDPFPGNGVVTAPSNTPEALIWDMHGQSYPVNAGETTYSWQTTALAWSPDGRYLGVAGVGLYAGVDTRCPVRVWDIAGRRLLTTYTGNNNTRVDALAWSHDGRYLASSGKDNTVQIWEPASGKTIFTYRGHSDSVTSISWSPNNKHLVSLSGQDGAQVWDIASGKQLARYDESFFNGTGTDIGNGSRLRVVAWAHDGTRIACGGENGYVQIWQAPQ